MNLVPVVSMLLLLLVIGALFVIGKWQVMQRFVWVVVGVYGVVLIVSPVVYQVITKDMKTSYTAAEEVTYQNQYQQFLTDLTVGERTAYNDDLLFTKTIAYHSDLFYVNGEQEEHQLFFVVEETPELHQEIEVSVYKRPFLIEQVDASELYPAPTVTMRGQTLKFKGQHDTVYINGYGVQTFPKVYDTDTVGGNNPYIAYLRVPMHTRVLDSYDKRIDQQLLEGGMLDGH